MKRCPKCNREYRDDSLRFCLEDGASLVSSTRAEPPPTEILPAPLPPTQASSETIPSYSSAPVYAPPPDRRRPNPFLIVGVIAIVLLLIALVALAAVYVIQHPGPGNSNQANAESPTPRRLPTPEPTKQLEPGASGPSPLANGPLQITATASSVRLAVQANTYDAANAIDGKSSTAWIEGVSGPGIGEWIRFDFDREINLHTILVQPGYFKGPQVWAQNNRLAKVTAQFSDGSSRALTFDDRMDSQRFDVGAIRTRWVRLVIGSVYEGTNPGPNDDTALSEVAFEWQPDSSR
ncbi:MAG TPA: discoidin domain-containing protein [Pyrinomonadaceae bacterium]|nr:discoidin domain-containing protein [Pyrinomonadaceae bacterium]